MSAWIPALHAGMTELRGPCVHLNETPLAIFSKEYRVMRFQDKSVIENWKSGIYRRDAK
jgi:hypothetical protein